MTVRVVVTWLVGLTLIAGSGLAPGAYPSMGLVWFAAICLLSALLVGLFAWGRWPAVLDAAAVAMFAATWVAGARAGFSGSLLVLGVGAVASAYFLGRLTTRLHEERETTNEGRARAHEAIAFATRRIIAVTLLATTSAWSALHAPAFASQWVSPRWAVSMDADAVELLGALAIAILTAATGWTFIRLGRTVRAGAVDEA